MTPVDKVIVEVLKGGPGLNNWKILHMFQGKTGLIMTNPDGGGVEYTDIYQRNYDKGGDLEIVKTIKSGQPQPYTYNLELPIDTQKVLDQMFGRKNIRVRFYCNDYSDPNNYSKMYIYCDSRNTTRGFNRNMADNSTNVTDPLRRVMGQRAAYELEVVPVALVDIKGTVTTQAINRVLNVGYVNEGGDQGCCGENLPNDGNQDFLLGSNGVAAGVPNVIWTRDGGNVWTTSALTGMTNGSISGLAKAGGNIVASMTGAGGGLVWAKLSEIRLGTATWTRSTNISAGTVVNAVVAVSASTLYAFGAAGEIWRSTDGGVTFTLWTDVGTANFTVATVVDENLIWIGTTSTVAYKIQNGVASAVTVTGLGAVAINSIEVPKERPCEVYIGTADGKVIVSYDTGTSWTTRFNAGSGSIDVLRFADGGNILYFVQTNGSTQSRVGRDFSGGYFGADIEYVSTYTNPTNATFNDMAVSSTNVAMVGGDITGGQGFIGKVA